jgi:N-dimethylarginine dimethylaminohydrolase
MKWFAIILGIVLGAGMFGLIQQMAAPPDVRYDSLLSDCDGAIDELVIQYEAGSSPIATPVYRSFLSQLPAEITVHVVCPSQNDFDDLRNQLPPVQCQLKPVITDHPHSAWSRDRWIARRGSDGTIQLIHPRGEAGAENWPARAGDQRIADDLAARLPRVRAYQSHLYFDGGDFVADRRMVFVTPRVNGRNVQHTVDTHEQMLTALKRLAGPSLCQLPDAPDHHAGMFMMPIGNHTVLVGDPALARSILEKTGPLSTDVIDPDRSPQIQQQMDNVATFCQSQGYRVQRIPIVPGVDGRTYLSYVNVIIDDRAGRRIVYMPVYDGADPLNQAAAACWRSNGYEVRPVNCTTAYQHSGSLRCLVNVLRRG